MWHGKFSQVPVISLKKAPAIFVEENTSSFKVFGVFGVAIMSKGQLANSNLILFLVAINIISKCWTPDYQIATVS